MMVHGDDYYSIPLPLFSLNFLLFVLKLLKPHKIFVILATGKSRHSQIDRCNGILWVAKTAIAGDAGVVLVLC